MTIARYKDLCIDAVDAHTLGAFWGRVLGWTAEPDEEDARLTDGDGKVYAWINKVPEAKRIKNRVHLDVFAESVDDVEAAGATILDDQSFKWTLMHDPDGQEFCLFLAEQPERRFYSLVFDCNDGAAGAHRIAAWWAGVLGGDLVDDDRGFSYIKNIQGAPFEGMDFIPVPEPKTAKNRVHIDVLTDDVQALIDRGAARLRPKGDDGIRWHVMADPDGNEFCAFTPD
jgi:hypothetical protein